MSLVHAVHRGVVVVMIALLAACATAPPGGEVPPVKPVEKPAEPVIVTPPPVEYETPPRAATHSASAAWQPLLAKAEQAVERGDYEQALALLERAQRIDPDSAEVYLGIARTHLAKGDTAQARATAERGLMYCSSAAVCDTLRALTR
jgi:tetratricopeptide (TPR) repeat protein